MTRNHGRPNNFPPNPQDYFNPHLKMKTVTTQNQRLRRSLPPYQSREIKSLTMLIDCPTCGRQVSDQAVACPHCGQEKATGSKLATERSQAEVRKAKIRGTIIAMIVSTLLLIFVFIPLWNSAFYLGAGTSLSSYARQAAAYVLDAKSPTEMVTLTEPESIQTESGTVALPVGTRLRFVSQINTKVRVHYLNSDYIIPIAATDLNRKRSKTAK